MKILAPFRFLCNKTLKGYVKRMLEKETTRGLSLFSSSFSLIVLVFFLILGSNVE